VIDANVRRRVSRAIERAVGLTLSNASAGLSENETDMTSRLAARIEDSLNGLRIGRVRIHASVRTLQDRGPGAAEKRYGADLLIVLRINVGDAQVTKGVLVQSKMSGADGVRLSGEQRVTMTTSTVSGHLRRQCMKMQSHTAESFVWVYGPQDVRSAPATSISESSGPSTVRSTSLPNFFEGMLDCTVGDTRLVAVDDRTLDDLAEGLDASHVLAIEAIEGDGEPAFTAERLG
jgi:hypothetical protein